jgi:hypothetical protein
MIGVLRGGIDDQALQGGEQGLPENAVLDVRQIGDRQFREINILEQCDFSTRHWSVLLKAGA